MSDFQEDKINRKLGLLKRKEEEDVARLLSEKYKLPYLDLSVFPVETDALKTIPEDRAISGELAAVQSSGRDIKIAVRNPDKDQTISVLRGLKEAGYSYELYLVSLSGLRHAWESYRKISGDARSEAGTISVKDVALSDFKKRVKNSGDAKFLLEKTFGSKTSEVLEAILACALAVGASDVHIESQDTDARLRFRLDGVLEDTAVLTKKLYSLILSRIKLLSELKLNVKDKAQDGRFTIKEEGADIEIRTSTLPGPYGENIVLRILDPKSIGVGFNDLGIQPWVVQILEKELKKPNGMILTTGPTGSGKTTTLYAFLKKVHGPEIKTITLEDPIEYHLPGVEQTQTDSEKGYDFASGLRSILRQDPDVILVGEIRDKETAETAMHAALTGHLVFSTLHTNNAAAAIPRLLDLGVKPAVIAPALNVSMAQRLLRKLCPLCKIKHELSAEDIKKIRRELENFPKQDIVPADKEWTVFTPHSEGCSGCNNGYKGRIGIYEVILIDERMENLIMKEPSEIEMKEEAQKQGQINILQDGLLKILAGVTDFGELERVAGEFDSEAEGPDPKGVWSAEPGK